MKRFYIDEKVVVWKRTSISLPDDIPCSELVKQLDINRGAAGLLNSKITEDWWDSEEYLPETEEPFPLTRVIFNEDYEEVDEEATI